MSIFIALVVLVFAFVLNSFVFTQVDVLTPEDGDAYDIAVAQYTVFRQHAQNYDEGDTVAFYTMPHLHFKVVDSYVPRNKPFATAGDIDYLFPEYALRLDGVPEHFLRKVGSSEHDLALLSSDSWDKERYALHEKIGALELEVFELRSHIKQRFNNSVLDGSVATEGIVAIKGYPVGANHEFKVTGRYTLPSKGGLPELRFCWLTKLMPVLEKDLVRVESSDYQKLILSVQNDLWAAQIADDEQIEN